VPRVPRAEGAEGRGRRGVRAARGEGGAGRLQQLDAQLAQHLLWQRRGRPPGGRERAWCEPLVACPRDDGGGPAMLGRIPPVLGGGQLDVAPLGQEAAKHLGPLVPDEADAQHEHERAEQLLHFDGASGTVGWRQLLPSARPQDAL